MEPTQTGAREAEPTADSAGSAGRPGLEPPRVDPPIRRRKRKKGPCPEASAAKAKATSAEAAAEAPLTVEEAAAKAPAPPPPALALRHQKFPCWGWTPRKFRPRRSRRTSPRSRAFELSTVWTIPSGVPLTVRREVESWTMETATMPTTPSFFQRMERGLSPAAAMITLHRDLTLRLEGHMAWQAPYFIRMVDDPETKHRKPEYWYRCKVCQKWLDVAHLQGQTHSTNMQAYMQEGNPHLTAEHPLEAIPRNYREACIEGYADLGLHRIAGEFRRIVEAERRRTEPKAKSRPKSPQAKARPAESKKAKAPATAKKTKAPAAATVEKAEAPEPPVKRAPEAFRRSGVWLEENPPPEPAAEVGPAAARPDSAAPMEIEEQDESWGAWHRRQLRPRWRQQLRRL